MHDRDEYGRSNGNRDEYRRRSARRWDDQSRDDDIAGANFGDWDETSPSRDLNRASSYTSQGERNVDRGGYRSSGRSAGEYRSSSDYPAMPYRGAYGSGYATQQRGGFQSFRPDDYGGADFTSHTSGTPYGGYGASYDSETYGTGRAWRTAGEDRNRNDRGFFDRATDEVASWFGDEDAARRREMDHTGRGPSNYTRSDDRIKEDVCDRLTDDWQVDASEVTVSVDEGEVTLDGTVESRAAKRRAEDCAERISGVRHVQNNLRVRQSAITPTTGSTTSTLGTTSSQGYSSH